MTPKNALQVEICSLSKELPKLTEEQKSWAFKSCMAHKGRKTKSGIDCLDCGTKFNTTSINKKCTCPNCGTTLTVVETTKQIFKDDEKFTVIEVYKGYQLIRHFEIFSSFRVGTKAETWFREVVQFWILPNGKYEVLAKIMNGFTGTFCGMLELRTKKQVEDNYNIYPKLIYPKVKCLPILKRNGFSKSLMRLSPFDTIRLLLVNRKAETLAKAKQVPLFYATKKNDTSIEKYWSAIKGCIRKGYIVTDAQTWLDYVELLEFFKRDLTNPKYTCPVDLEKEHNKYVRKKTDLIFKQKTEELQGKMEVSQKEYFNSKHQYFGITLTSGNLTISVLEDVKEFLHEAMAHRHCVFTNEYYKKENSLILSAKVDGIPTETIELDLKDMTINQSRGIRNKPTVHHKAILKLLSANMNEFRKAKQAA